MTATTTERDEVPEYRQFRYVRPADATEIVLVRHGETVAARSDEPFPLLAGQGDPALSEEGREQAERVASRLAATEVAAVYVTTLCRTEQTAPPLAAKVGLEPVVEADLREVFLGEWEAASTARRWWSGTPSP